MKNLIWYVCGCLLALGSALAQAQSTPDLSAAGPTVAAAATRPASSTNRPASVGLGRLWVTVARWQWHLKKPGQPVPSFDSTNVDAFWRSMRNADSDGNPANINKLYNEVLYKLGRKGYDGVGDEAFIKALEAVLKTKTTKPKTIITATNLAALVKKLEHLKVVKASLVAEASTRPETPEATSEATAAQQTTPSTVDKTGRKLQQARQANAKLLTQRLLLALAAGFFGIIATFLAFMLLKMNSKRQNGNSSPADEKMRETAGGDKTSKPKPATHPGTTKHTLSADTPSQRLTKENASLLEDLKKVRWERNKLAEHNQALQAELEQIRQEQDRRNNPEADRDAPAVSVVDPPPVSVVASPAPLAQFAEMPENRRLDRLYSDSDAYRPVLVRLPADPAIAEAPFEFNPNADQYFFTHNGVDQLLGTFAYPPPNWGCNPQSIRTLAPGRLRRDGNGWLVVTPAQIEIS